MKKFLTAPGFLSPYGTFGADFSSIMAWGFTLLFVYGWYLGRKHQGQRHHLVTLWGMVAMLAYFTTYYLARGLGALSIEGREGFGGPDWIYDYIFSPILTIHILVISLGLVLAIYMIVLGFRSSAMKKSIRYLKSEPLVMEKKSFNTVLIGSGVTFGLLAVIRSGPLARYIVYLAGFLLVVMVLFAERWFERAIPDGAKRHRKLGTFTMVLYVIALLTSTVTYVMLYYIYPVKDVS